MRFCFCKDWQDNINILLAFINLGKQCGFEEKIKTYVYCPWCGKDLMTEKELTDNG